MAFRFFSHSLCSFNYLALRLSGMFVFLLSFNAFASDEKRIQIITEHYPPYQILDPETGVLNGIRTELVNKMLRQSGLSYDVKIMPWARGYKTVQENKNACIYTIMRMPFRDKLFRWVGSIGQTDGFMYVRKDKASTIQISQFSDAKNYMTVVQREDVLQQFMELNGFERGKNFITVTDWSQAIQMILKGRADIITTNQLILAHYMQSSGYNISILAPAFEVKELANSNHYFACNKAFDDKLFNKLQTTLNLLRENGEVTRIEKKWAESYGLTIHKSSPESN